MKMIPRPTALAIALVAAMVANSAIVELEWMLPDGRVERETRQLEENDDVSVFSLPCAEITAKGAKELSIIT